jgi:ribosomal-protein-alanine N-acetyltransferase
MTVLTTERLIMRPITPADATVLFEARRDPDVMRYWDWPEQKSIAQVESIIADHQPYIDDGEVIWWTVALKADGRVVGECDLSEIDHHHRRAEIGFMFNRAYWGNGYAFEAAGAAMHHAFVTMGIERLWARTHAGNDASCRLLERLGFSLEGRLRDHIVRDGKRRDCLIYGRMR